MMSDQEQFDLAILLCQIKEELSSQISSQSGLIRELKEEVDKLRTQLHDNIKQKETNKYFSGREVKNYEEPHRTQIAEQVWIALKESLSSIVDINGSTGLREEVYTLCEYEDIVLFLTTKTRGKLRNQDYPIQIDLNFVDYKKVAVLVYWIVKYRFPEASLTAVANKFGLHKSNQIDPIASTCSKVEQIIYDWYTNT